MMFVFVLQDGPEQAAKLQQNAHIQQKLVVPVIMKQAILVFQAKQPTKSVKQMFVKDTPIQSVRQDMLLFQQKCVNQVRLKNINVKHALKAI